jgi:uncharacterized protein YjbI with pentapeptide repeats
MPDLIESREQLNMLRREGAMRGYHYKQLRLSGLDVSGQDLSGAIFESCDLDGADFSGADLRRTQFRKVDLSRARMDGALLVRTAIHSCHVMELDLTAAQLRGVDFDDCDMANNLRLQRAHLSDCRFASCNTYGICLEGAVLVRCAFSHNQLGAAQLTRARMEAATLIDVDLQGANLIRADLRRAMLVKCNLRGAQLKDAQLHEASLIGCATFGADLPHSYSHSTTAAPTAAAGPRT